MLTIILSNYQWCPVPLRCFFKILFLQFFERQIQSQGKCTFDGIGQELYKEVMMKNAWLNKPEEPGIARKLLCISDNIQFSFPMTDGSVNVLVVFS